MKSSRIDRIIKNLKDKQKERMTTQEKKKYKCDNIPGIAICQ